MLLGYTFVACFGAIALEEIVQRATLTRVINAYGSVSIAYGLYLGIQTSAFEVGLAYVVARCAVQRSGMTAKEG